MSRFFKPMRRPGFSAYFRTSPAELERLREARRRREQATRERIKADIARIHAESRQTKIQLTNEEAEQ